MTHMLKIVPSWDEVAGQYTGEVLGFAELGEIRGGQHREEFQAVVSEQMARLNPPRRDFVIEWADSPREFHIAA